MRTVVNVSASVAGHRFPVHFMPWCCWRLCFGAGGLACEIPHAVFAGILIKVGTDIIDWDFCAARRTPGTDVFIMAVVVFLLTVFADLIKAVAVGMAIAGLIFMKVCPICKPRSINMYRDADESTPLQGEERRHTSGIRWPDTVLSISVVR